jgi:endonuclease IV
MDSKSDSKIVFGKYGCHCSVGNILDYDLNIYGAVQVFANVPQTGAPILAKNIENITSIAKKCRLYIHTPYVERFKEDEKNLQKSYDYLDIATKVGAVGLVYHIPKAPIADIVSIIDRLVFIKHKLSSNVKILMEQPAYKAGANTYEQPEKLNKLIKACSKFRVEDLGFVLDTAHIYASGVDIRDYKVASDYLNKIEEFNRIDLLHLNGNEIKNDVCKDKHTVPLSDADKIWGGIEWSDSGCKAFFSKFIANGKDVIFEVKQDHQIAEVYEMLRSSSK